MKFFVALESRSALVLALWSWVCKKTFNVIDCRLDKYTFSVLISLIKAEVIRRWENLDCPLILALHCTSLSGIMRVSNSLTRGIGSGYIDGELGLWWFWLCGWISRHLYMTRCDSYLYLTCSDSLDIELYWLIGIWLSMTPTTRSDSYPYYKCVLGSLKVKGSVYSE